MGRGLYQNESRRLLLVFSRGKPMNMSLSYLFSSKGSQKCVCQIKQVLSNICMTLAGNRTLRQYIKLVCVLQPHACLVGSPTVLGLLSRKAIQHCSLALLQSTLKTHRNLSSPTQLFIHLSQKVEICIAYSQCPSQCKPLNKL